MRPLAALLALAALAPIACQDGPRVRPGDMPRRGGIDDILGPRRFDEPAGVPIGATGARLWCQGLAPVPGLRGTFQYIHSGLHASLFDLDILENGQPLALPPMSHRWYPSHVIMETQGAALSLHERKFVTWDDRAVDVVAFRNHSADTRRLTLRLRTPLPAQPIDSGLAVVDRLFGVPFGVVIGAGGFTAAKERERAHAAVNALRRGLPEPRASFTYATDSPWAAVDGGYAAEKRWTSWSSGNASDWFEVDFGTPRAIDRLVLHLFDDQRGVWPPTAFRVEAEVDNALREIADQAREPAVPAAGRNVVRFPGVTTRRVRVTFQHRPGRGSGLVEFEVYPDREMERPVLQRELVVPPYGRASFTAVAAFASDVEGARARAARTASEDPDAVAGAHIAEYNAWFEREAPRFECPDPFFEKLWWYRWYVVRHNLADPKAGFLQEPCFYEGRYQGWYPQVITYGHAMQCAEARWLRDRRFAYGHLNAVLRNQFEGREGYYAGMFPNMQVDRRVDFYYTDWIPRGAWDVAMVHPDPKWMEQALPRLEKNVRGLLARFDPDQDGLPAVFPQTAGDAHFHTGMEWQPSFFFFGEPGFERETPVERVDFACYLYASCRAIAAMKRELRQDPAEFDMLATRTAGMIQSKMWDRERKFFYSLRPETDEKALVEEVVGFYPHAFGVPVPEAVFGRLFDPSQFWAPFPAHSASKRAELYSQTKPAGCRWNGPTWPFANSLVVEALASAVRTRPEAGVSRRAFFDFLQRYARSQFEEGDLGRPNVGEFLDSETGAWQTSTRDYFHSSWADLIVRHVGGLVPRTDDKLEFWPIVDAWDRWKLEGVPYRGLLLDIEWRKGSGFLVRAQGAALFRWPELEHIVFDPATGKVTRVE